MQYRVLGRTGIHVSRIAFGCGPVSGWMEELDPDDQCLVIRHAIDLGINWFDTAAGYGDGKSETSLGVALRRLGRPAGIHIATKVRYPAGHLGDIRKHTRTSVAASLKRLGAEQITLLQLHNSITASPGEEAASITPQDILGKEGILEAFRELQAQGIVQHIGLTGIGQPGPLREVVGSGEFAVIQVPYNLLNPSAGQRMPDGFPETDYGNIIVECETRKMGVFAIRVFAGGALLGNPPSAHTFKTRFFPLDLYERDRSRAACLSAFFPTRPSLHAAALQFVLAHPGVGAAIIGFRTIDEIGAAVASLASPSPVDALAATARLACRAQEDK
jgi:aryl-alcohol dehydrogenase-like predicted oxidoreductase